MFGAWDEVRDETFDVVVAIPRDHRAFPDIRVTRQHGLDLAELDPISTDLDLEVGPAEVLDPAIRSRRTTSPVRYSRRAGPDPNAWSMKRSAVRSGRLR